MTDILSRTIFSSNGDFKGIKLSESVLTLNEFVVNIYKEDTEGNKVLPEIVELSFCQNLSLNEQIEVIEELDNDTSVIGSIAYNLSFEIFDFLSKNQYNNLRDKNCSYWIELISTNDNTGEVETHTLKRCMPSGTWTISGQDNSIMRVQCEYATRYKE